MTTRIGHIRERRLKIDISDDVRLIIKLRQDFGAGTAIVGWLIQPGDANTQTS